MTIHLHHHGSIAVLTLDQPPINSLGRAMRAALASAITQALQDPDVAALILIGAGKGFSGGADIKEFANGDALQEPTLHSLIDLIEAADKPIIAALHGICIGGGLELALACHYRVAAAKTRLALPEIRLGLLPGAGGTQRLPRAVSVALALDMMLSGTFRTADSFAQTRLLDSVVPGERADEILAQALEYARAVLQQPAEAGLPLLRQVQLDPLAAREALQLVRAATPARDIPPGARLACIDAVQAAVDLSCEQGLQHERAAFFALLATSESRAMRHVFFAERAAAKLPDVPAELQVPPIAKVAVIGGGTMGRGIALSLLAAGLQVRLVEQGQAALDQALTAIEKEWQAAVMRGRMDATEAEARRQRLAGATAFDSAADVDLAIEAVPEDETLKQQVLRQLDTVLPPHALLATNTSTLDVNRLAAATRRPQQVLGLHFFSPAHRMRLLEIVRGAVTSPAALASALAFARQIGKIGVVAGVCDGFIGNRMLERYLQQACFLLEEGALPEQVDQAIERFGLAMGPFRMCDLAGNDIGWQIRRQRRERNPEYVYSRIPDLLCEAGRFGQKTGAGWYDYVQGTRQPAPAPAVAALIAAQRQAQGLQGREIGDEEILQRLLFALVNEGARLLQEGIAQRASDIDVVYVHGYGFPVWRGGPMFHADMLGLDHVLSAIRRFQQGRQGELWHPAPLLERLAAAGGRFT